MAEKEKPGAKRTLLEEELKDKNTYELAARRMGAPAQIRRMLGDTSYDYGTSLGKGAKATETEVSNKAFSEGKSLREMEPEVRKAMREAAAEERREARGMKKGGSASKFIQSAIKKPGALRKSLGVKKGEKIPASKLAKAAKAPGKMGQRARLAQTLKKMK